MILIILLLNQNAIVFPFSKYGIFDIYYILNASIDILLEGQHKMCHKLSYRCKNVLGLQEVTTQRKIVSNIFSSICSLKCLLNFQYRRSAKAYFLLNIHSAISLVLCQIKGLIDMIKRTNVIDPNSSQPVIKRPIFCNRIAYTFISQFPLELKKTENE